METVESRVEEMVQNHNSKFITTSLTHFNEIRYGRGVKMYTLWSISPKNMLNPENYIQNLGVDYFSSVEKALALSKHCYLEIDAPDDLRNIVRGEDVIRFGKYKDIKICNLPDNYLEWVAGGGRIPDEEYEGMFKYLVGSPLKEIAQEEGIKRGVLGIFNDKVLPLRVIEAIKARMEQDAKSEYIGTIGDKVTLEVTMVKYASFQNDFGVTNIYTFRDDNGNVIVYKGGSYLTHANIVKDEISGLEVRSDDKKFWGNTFSVGVDKGRYHTIYNGYNVTQQQHDQLRSFDFQGMDANTVNLKTGKFWMFVPRDEQSGKGIQKGDRVTIKGSIKAHTEYNSTKQTYLQRVSIV